MEHAVPSLFDVFWGFDHIGSNVVIGICDLDLNFNCGLVNIVAFFICCFALTGYTKWTALLTVNHSSGKKALFLLFDYCDIIEKIS
jgi:hypothetical protein